MGNFDDLTGIVKHAAGLGDAVAADLAVAGGILRCPTCAAEQPVGDIASHLRGGWPSCCGQAMTWVTRKMLAAEAREVPDGYELAAVVSEWWRLESGKLCARQVRRQTCRRPSVAALNRGQARRARDGSIHQADAWWPYCPDHMYGNWIEGGQVMHWILRKRTAGDD